MGKSHRSLMSAFALCLLLVPLAAHAEKNKVHAVVNVSLGQNYDVLSGNFEYSYARWTLFEDGTVFDRMPSAAPQEFDADASKKKQPKAWGTWKIKRGVLYVVWNGMRMKGDNDPRAYDNWFPLEIPKAGSTLSGGYSKLGSVNQTTGDTSYSATGWQTIVFRDDGSFSAARGGSGSHSSSSGSVTSHGSQESDGTYSIKGPVLEMKYSDGRVVRSSLFYADKNKKIIFINGVQLMR
jgi:hypothetical protein